MEVIDYLKRKEFDDTRCSSIRSQVLSLKELLNNKENFKEKDDWKRTSFITNREEDP